MNDIDTLLSSLRRRNVRLWLEEGEICYEAPKGQLTPDLLDRMRAHKEELREALRSAAAGSDAQRVSYRPVARGTDSPLSLAQEGIWIDAELAGPNPAYHVSIAFLLDGRFNNEAFDRAVNEIVRRHEILRSAIVVEGTTPLLRVFDEVKSPVTHVDLTGLSEADRLNEARNTFNREIRRPFTFSRAPLMRVILAKLDDRKHALLILMHHVVSDWVSLGNLTDELATLYGAFSAGRESPLADLDIQYADYAIGQREWVAGAAIRPQFDYWRRQLAGMPPVLEMPVDKPRLNAAAGARLTRHLDAGLTERLATLATQSQTSLFMLLAAAYSVFISRYSGREDVAVGFPVAGRDGSELEPLIGIFVNLLVLRSDLGGNPRFAEVLQQVRNTALDAYANQDVPFEELVRMQRPERTLEHAPLVQVTVMYTEGERELLDLPGLAVEPLEIEVPGSQFDLMLEVRRRGDSLEAAWTYRSDLFEVGTVERMTANFQTLLEGILADPQQRIGSLPLLGRDERRLALGVQNNTVAGSSGSDTIPELFARQVEKTPDAVAVVFEDRRLTYRQLNEKANLVADYLSRRSVGPDSLVAIYMDRSLEMIVAILGILKAGGAYLPIDLLYPRQRVAFILDESHARLIVTQEGLLDELPDSDAEIVCLDRDWDAISSADSRSRPCPASADNLAYVIYTSGSTGRPKGVLVTHGNVVRLFTETDAWFGFSSDDVWTLFHSYAFDFSVWELWGALLYGGRLVVVPYLMSRSPAEFIELLCREGVTVLNQTPSAFGQLITAERQSPDRRQPLCLRLVIFGGEALNPQMLQPWFDRHGDRSPQLVNMYGITETTVHVTCYPLSRADLERSSRSPIGRPIPDLDLYILDRYGNPSPIGVSGELYVGGRGVARGYLNRPELTRERFVSNPFTEEQGATLYRTGDVGRRLPDGSIDYLGRCDNQVKIRGFRIELGEIEAALRTNPAVRDAVVVVREDSPQEKRLAAYVVRHSAAAATAGDLREHLAGILPSYMVPAALVFLDKLPLSPNGKIDHGALPIPKQARDDDAAELVAPRTPVEETLWEIWRELLRVDRIGIHDNFFALGGDSIIAIQVAAKAADAGIHLKPGKVFQTPTIAGLASTAVESSTAPIDAEQGQVTGEVPLTPIQRWFFDLNLVDPEHYNQAMLLKLDAGVDTAALEQSIREVTGHHDAFRLAFSQHQGQWRQTCVGSPDKTSLESIDLSNLAPGEHTAAIEAAAAETQRSLDLGSGPVARFVLFDLGTGRPGRLLVVVHHLLIDGVSWRILLDDLQTVYRQATEDRPLDLPRKTTSLKRWAELLTEESQSNATKESLAYWTGERWGRAGTLPVDYRVSPEANTVASVRTVSSRLDVEYTKALLRETAGAYNTEINDILLAAVALCCRARSGNEALAVTLEGHGREDLFDSVSLARTVGWFTSIYPVLLDLSRSEGPGEAVKTIKEQLRAVPDGGIRYGMAGYLRHDKASSSPLDRLPRPQISFNYLGQFDQVFDSSGLFSPAPESAGPMQSAGQLRLHDLEIDGMVVDGRLEFTWRYSTAIHRHDTIAGLADGFIRTLRSLIDHCRSPESGGYTPSDFPTAGLSQEELDLLAGEDFGEDEIE